MDVLVFDGFVYVSIDLDGFDFVYVFGVFYLEFGGFIICDVIGLLYGIMGEVVGVDVVEYNL